jgi:lipoprotein-anchoring transpeptidase ErfK/SrfK
MPCSELSLVLKGELLERLKALGIPASKHCLVVSIDQQKLWYFAENSVHAYKVSTARAGRGCIKDSLQTPVGVLRVAEKHGSGALPGMVFKARQPTGEVWQRGMPQPDNLITSRILWLEGMESGVNAGEDDQGRVVDTKSRFIYIHGTNQEEKLGQPNSHGCVLLSDADVIELYERVPLGTFVYIA